MIRFILKIMMLSMLCNLLVLEFLIANIPPEISYLSRKDITETSATIIWETDFETYAQLNYGLSMDKIFNVVVDANKSRAHVIKLNKLLKGTHYYYKIVTKHEGKTYLSKINSFRTKGIPVPGFIELKIQNTKPSSAEIKYILNTPSRIILTYNSKNKTKKYVLKTEQFKDKGSFLIKNLTPDTVYYYILEVENKPGEKTRTKIAHFTTPSLNYALNKKVSGTFNAIPDDPFFNKNTLIIDRITDGKINYFYGMATSRNVDKEDQFVIIDLGGEYKISKIKVFWRALAYSKDYSLYISKDNKNWKKTFGKIDASKGQNARGDKGDPIKVNTISFDPENAGYIKLFIKKGSKYHVKHKKWNFVQIMEIMVF